MTTIGGKSLADDVRIGLTGLKKQIDGLKLDAAAALTELSAELKNGNEGVKRIREETAAVKAACRNTRQRTGDIDEDVT
jgi:hypothetical protein